MVVSKEPAIYLFLGQDSLSKELKLKQIRQAHLSPAIEQFNLDILYAREVDLRKVQERFLCLPVGAKKRVIVIKDAQALKEEVKGFILKFAGKPFAPVVLILDFFSRDIKDDFLNSLKKQAAVFYFKEEIKTTSFVLGRQISMKKTAYALRILSQLLGDGEDPTMILGGLRYGVEKDALRVDEKRKKLRLLLDCDTEIKTGKLKPSFALEKLVVGLCRG